MRPLICLQLEDLLPEYPGFAVLAGLKFGGRGILFIFAAMLETAPYPFITGSSSPDKLAAFLDQEGFSKVAVLADHHTVEDCYSLLKDSLPPHSLITVPAGETQKSVTSCIRIWDVLTREQFDRKSVLVNVGGGMVGDLGGYAAACFKRGMRFIQVPTSLLAMVDASAGGKTGINFSGFKNQVGVFQNPAAVVLFAPFLNTLAREELVSGFAELVKHALVGSREQWDALVALPGLPEDWESWIPDSVTIKLRIVASDPLEKGPRKALNFGHTLGHALESWSFGREGQPGLRHGEAVAAGMLGEAWLSWKRGLLDQDALEQIGTYLLRIFPAVVLPEAEIPAVAALARQDKKNQHGRILCTLMNGIGDFKTDMEISVEEIASAFQYYRSVCQTK